MDEDYEFINNKEKSQYELRIDGQVARIEYTITQDGDIILTHTEVPRALKGKGIGTRLVEKAFADIEREKLHLVPLCPFTASIVKDNPKWAHIVKKGLIIK